MKTLQKLIYETVFSDAAKTGKDADGEIAAQQLIPVFDGLIVDANNDPEKFKKYAMDTVIPLLDSINKVTHIETPLAGKQAPGAGIVFVHCTDRGYIPSICIFSKADNRTITIYPNPGSNVVIQSDLYTSGKFKGIMYDFKEQPAIISDLVKYMFPLRLKHIK